MKLCRVFLSSLSVSALIMWTAAGLAADLVVQSQILNGPEPIVYDSAEGIVFAGVVVNAGADVTADAAYEVTLKPGTKIRSGARFTVSLKDKDGLPNRWEMGHCGTLAYGPGDDPDRDGLIVLLERQNGTNPCGPDSDGDGLPDGWEVQHGFNPLVDDAGGDADRDGLSNLDEFLNDTDPREPDSDGDGMPDGWEVKFGLNPRHHDAHADRDLDGHTNINEYAVGTNPDDPAHKPAEYNYFYDNNGNLETMQQQ